MAPTVTREDLDAAWPRLAAALRPLAIARAGGDLADDVIQEAYLRAVGLLSEADLPHDALQTWAARIIERVAYQARRRRPDVITETAASEVDLLRRIAAADRDAALRTLIEQVDIEPAQRRYILTRLDLESDQAAAAALGVSVETLQQGRSRALRRIRTVVEAALTIAGDR